MRLLYLTLFFVFFLATSAAAAVNINTGDVGELTSLPGIGPVKAEAIIKYRKENGLFKDIDELDKVYGIGKKTIARIKKDITVGKAAPAETATTVNKKSNTTTPGPQAEQPAASTKPAVKK
jgi:competence protein ComEA